MKHDPTPAPSRTLKALGWTARALLWVVLAALLLSPRRHWAWFAALMLPVEVLVDWGTYSVPQSLGFAVANILEVLVAAHAITRLCGRVFSVQRVVHVGWFVVLGAGLTGRGLYRPV